MSETTPEVGSVSWIGLIVVIVGVYLAFKVAGAALQLALWLVILVAGYWFAAPMLGWPPLENLFGITL